MVELLYLIRCTLIHRSGSKVPRGTSKLLLTFSQQVALGMKYITDKGFVHGNLKASNVMMSSDNECKVSTNFSAFFNAQNMNILYASSNVKYLWNE